MVTSLRDTLDSDDYDEFGLLHENAAEWDIPFDEPAGRVPADVRPPVGADAVLPALG